MTMMMMQRLLQQDNQTELNQQQNSTARSAPFGFTTATANANVLHHHPSSAFLRPTAVKKDGGDTKDADDENSFKDVDSTVATPSTNPEDDLHNSNIRLCSNSSGGDKSPQTNGDNKNSSSSRLSMEESSMDVECNVDRGGVEEDDEDERLSSDEDYLNVDEDEDEDAGSPVDLTSRHRLLNRLSVADKLPHFRQTDASSPSTVSEANEDNLLLQSPPPSRQHDHRDRRLAFSVENILDPNKFTGKEKEAAAAAAAVLRPTFHTHWRPHLDITSSSPDFTSGRPTLHNTLII